MDGLNTVPDTTGEGIKVPPVAFGTDSLDVASYDLTCAPGHSFLEDPGSFLRGPTSNG